MATKIQMIKLTLTPQTQPVSYIFEKNIVTIGSLAVSGSLPDLVLSQDDVQHIHVKIESIGGKFVAFNVAEDPFTTLNDFPFSRKNLQQGDLLQIGSTLIQFEGLYQETHLDKAPQQNTFEESSNIESFDFETAMRDLDEGGHPPDEKPNEINIIRHLDTQLQLADDELEDLMLRVEGLENLLCQQNTMATSEIEESHDKNEPPPVETAAIEHEVPTTESQPLLETDPDEEVPPEIISEPRIRRKSMKDDFSNDEENPSSSKENATQQSSLFFSITWKELLISFAAFSLLIAIVLGCLFVGFTGHNEEEEIKAAQAVADIAMALNFAQINHAEPQNQNWSEPEFLKHNLTAVLGSEYTPLANVDSQGQFYDISYILRIYTGADLNHFLIIAQPTPSLLQWLMPKATITVDSSFMVLRKISDLKTLNRLLVNGTLDTSNSADVTNFVQLGELLPLADLKKYHPHTGFELPKALALIHPGAENLIYNGVRYYPLGESLMKNAIDLYKSDDNEQDLLPLIDEISRFTQFPNIVLYSSEGMQMALRAQKALATFFPHYKFLHAYLQFDSERFPFNSHLLIDDYGDGLMADASAEDIVASEHADSQPDALNIIEDPTDTSADEKKNDINLENEIDQNHALYYKLMVLSHAREHSLMILGEEAYPGTTDASHDKGIPYKNSRQTIISNLQEKIIRAISALQQEYATIPFGLFMSYVKAAGLESLVEENLQNHTETSETMLQFESLFQSQLQKIQQSISLKKLNSNLNNMLQLLTLENVPDPKTFILYQNIIRAHALNRIDNFLFSPTENLPATDMKEENLTLLSRILKTVWIADEGELDYYLEEFNQLLSNM